MWSTTFEPGLLNGIPSLALLDTLDNLSGNNQYICPVNINKFSSVSQIFS